MNRRLKAAAAAAVVVYSGALLYVSTRPLATASRMSPASETVNNLAHIPAFGVLTLLILALTGVFSTGTFAWRISVSSAAAFIFGFLVEALQHGIPGRNASLRDIALNAAGIAAAASGAALLRIRARREAPAALESGEYV